MARIRKCDRCGETYEPYIGGFNTLEVSTYNIDNDCEGVVQTHDLCPKCKAELKAWFEAHGAKTLD